MSRDILDALAQADFTEAFGEITALGSDVVEATGPSARIGQFCALESRTGAQAVGEVVSVGKAGLRLAPVTAITNLALGDRVTLNDSVDTIGNGRVFSGRAVDGLGRPIDGGPGIKTDCRSDSGKDRSNPLDRIAPKERLLTGIRAIDALIPLGKGQRLGIFAASGVGKTSLLEQLMWQSDHDRIVVCLVGERGREVEKLWTAISARPDADKFTLVAATSDESASMRVRSIEQSLTIAEYWRDQGQHCMLFIDSITRGALALRELGIAAGEPPSTRGYTPNVFSALPKFVERCGALRGAGAITSVMTVLSETDDVDDPIVELMKSVLDGHIVLSRTYAERRHFPAIDISRSVSRLSDDLLSDEQSRLAASAHKLHAIYQDASAMIDSGLYKNGSNPEIDTAIAARPKLVEFLQQGKSERSALAETEEMLTHICHGGASGR